MNREHLQALIATFILLGFVCWAIPTCIRGPVEHSEENIRKYHELVRQYEGTTSQPIDNTTVIDESIDTVPLK